MIRHMSSRRNHGLQILNHDCLTHILHAAAKICAKVQSEQLFESEAKRSKRLHRKYFIV